MWKGWNYSLFQRQYAKMYACYREVYFEFLVSRDDKNVTQEERVSFLQMQMTL